jgi:hypothetical protein
MAAALVHTIMIKKRARKNSETHCEHTHTHANMIQKHTHTHTHNAHKHTPEVKPHNINAAHTIMHMHKHTQ